MENQTIQNPPTPTAVNPRKDFFDEDGELSFYVQNISNGDVHVSDLGILIPHLGVKDLRETMGIEKLKNSPGLREALSPKTGFLKRINLSEFDRLSNLQMKREGRIKQQRQEHAEKSEKQALADADGKIKEIKVDISPKVQSMVEKLRLHYRGQASTVTPEDFLVFAQNTKFNEDERSYVLGIVKEPSIRQAVMNQYQNEEVVK